MAGVPEGEITRQLARMVGGSHRARIARSVDYGETGTAIAVNCAGSELGILYSPRRWSTKPGCGLARQDHLDFEKSAALLRPGGAHHAPGAGGSMRADCPCGQRGGGAHPSPCPNPCVARAGDWISFWRSTRRWNGWPRSSPRQAQVIEMRYFGGLNVDAGRERARRFTGYDQPRAALRRSVAVHRDHVLALREWKPDRWIRRLWSR